MQDNVRGGLSRREFLKDTSLAAAAGSALFAASIPSVHAAQSGTIQLALVGCGGRGSGAVGDAMSTAGGPVKLVAMADVFENRLRDSYNGLKGGLGDRIDVPAERKFVGFDAYKKAMDCLKPGDVVILATPPAFRWVHFTYAIAKGLNVFMEKPISVDGASTKKMLALGDEAGRKNLKVGVGLMCRHSEARGQLFDQLRKGVAGDVMLLRAYRLHDAVGFFTSDPVPAGTSELMYQIQRFHSFIWASGGAYSDFYVHHIDECCWMKDAWPVSAHALGGRHFRGNSIDQNFDAYSVEYTFADGAKLYLEGRCMANCHNQFASLGQGTKGAFVISDGGHWPAPAAIYKGQNRDQNAVAWAYQGREKNPYVVEWQSLLDSIRKNEPHNEVKRGAEASLVTAMGRMAAHTGRVVSYEDALNAPELGPYLDQLTATSAAPLKAGADGKYPVPNPGRNELREF